MAKPPRSRACCSQELMEQRPQITKAFFKCTELEKIIFHLPLLCAEGTQQILLEPLSVGSSCLTAFQLKATTQGGCDSPTFGEEMEALGASLMPHSQKHAVRHENLGFPQGGREAGNRSISVAESPSRPPPAASPWRHCKGSDPQR